VTLFEGMRGSGSIVYRVGGRKGGEEVQLANLYKGWEFVVDNVIGC